MLIVDTDPGLDDAHALAVATKYVGDAGLIVTTVAGNATVNAVTDNAAWLLATLAPNVRLHRGSALPLLGAHEGAEHIHGDDGLGGVPRVPEQRVAIRPGHAVEVIFAAYRQHGSGLSLVALGPLTNIALALAIEPGLAECELTVMGGSPAGYGNASINAEYNIYADPVAAEAVFSRMTKTTLVTWDLTLTTGFTAGQVNRMFASESAAARLIGGIEAHRREQSYEYNSRSTFGRADGLAMSVAMDSSCIRSQTHHAVEVGVSGLARGLTSVDWSDITNRPPVRIIQTVNPERVLETLTL